MEEATVRARNEILAIWAALKQLSETINDAIRVVLLRLTNPKILTGCFRFLTIGTSPDKTEQSYSGGMF